MADIQPESLGKRLRQERDIHHWTQEELAEKIGGSVPSINRWENDRATPRKELLKLLAEAFGRPPEQWGTARQIPWNVPFLRNPYFTGREQLLEHLHETLAAKQTVALTQARAISGLGGIGKTQTAIEYAYCYGHEYEAVLWVRADTSETLLSDFAALAVVLDLPAQYERDQHYAVAAVKRWLQEHNPWLLIFDNADDPAAIAGFLPTRGRGAVLLTTRSQATGPHIKKIEMEKMSREEAIAFLLRRVHPDDEERLSGEISSQEQEAGEQLWEAVDGLPLALDQAAAYMEETGCSLSDYLALFRKGRRQLLRLRGKMISGHPEPVAATWLLAFERVRRASPVAAELLRFCALLHADQIPEAMIMDGADALGPVLQSITGNTHKWNTAIGELRKYSMVKRDTVKKMLNIHRLVQAVIRDSMSSKDLQEWAERVVLTVNAAFPDVKHETWQQCESLLPHALLAAQYIEEYQIICEEAGNLLYGIASYLYDRARYSEVELLYQKALDIREQRLGQEHLDVAVSLDGLAKLYHEQGRYAEAEPLYQRALTIREQRLGLEHPDVATSLYGLAELYSRQGRYAKAEELHLRGLTIREQQLELELLQVAASLNGLGLLYKEQGRYAEAEPLYQRSLAILEQQLGPEHPQVSSLLNNLAILYVAQGRYAEAGPLYQRSLTLAIQAYGEDNPIIATRLNNLGFLYYEQGKYMEVVPVFQRALRLWEQHLGEAHPYVASALSNLAEVYMILGKYTDAEPLYQQALRIWEQQTEPEHPNGAYPLAGLANLYREQGRYAEAEPLYQRALHIRQQAQGLEHPETAEVMHDFAQLREIQEDMDEAKSLYTCALAVREQVLGREHPKTTETRNRLKKLFDAMGLHGEAAQLEAAQGGQRTHKEERMAHPGE